MCPLALRALIGSRCVLRGSCPQLLDVALRVAIVKDADSGKPILNVSPPDQSALSATVRIFHYFLYTFLANRLETPENAPPSQSVRVVNSGPRRRYEYCIKNVVLETQE
jgi:hypothetical protein